MTTSGRLTRLRTALSSFFAMQVELHERHLLIQRPWEEEYLHWAWTGREWVLHGELLPPRGQDRAGARSSTRGGWCRFAATPMQAPTERP